MMHPFTLLYRARKDSPEHRGGRFQPEFRSKDRLPAGKQFCGQFAGRDNGANLMPNMNTTAIEAKGVLTLPGQGPVLRAFGEEVTILLSGAQTGGKFTLFSEITPPQGGPPLHYHEKEDELFFVIEGQASFCSDGQWTEVPAGTAVFMPRGVVHSFKNVGSVPLRQTIQTAPSGFERFFKRCADEFARPGGPDMKRIVEISGEHGVYFVDP
jgi:mannose-6-phosphate isomerase-like protein (cupin superfamily)